MKPEELKKEEASRVAFLKAGIIEQIQEHTPDTLGNLETCLKRGLESIEAEKEKLAVLARPLP